MTNEAQEKPFGGKRLFTVEIEQSIVVLANDCEEAEEEARRVATNYHDLDWYDATYSGYTSGYLPGGWANAIPWGSSDDNPKEFTCAQIRDALEEYERTRPRTKAELEALGQLSMLATAVAGSAEADAGS